MADQKLISLVIPVYNEAPNLEELHNEIIQSIEALPYKFEILFVDDGSADDSARAIVKIAKQDQQVQLVQLARNFGKEAAVSAGLQAVRGQAAIIMDADGQMPPRLIGQFLEKWERGSEVVVGIFAERNMSTLRRLGAQTFYKIMQIIGSSKITPNATDFRLLDREVVNQFNGLTERNRITRGLIDWLGYKRDYVYFKQEARQHGNPTYSFSKLVALAINSFTSYSLFPLKLAGYMGLFILTITIPSGIFMYVERYLLDDPLRLLFTGTDMLAVLTLFLVGVVLACLGLISLYIAHIHDEVVNRPLFIVRKRPAFKLSSEPEMRAATNSPKVTMIREEAVEG